MSWLCCSTGQQQGRIAHRPLLVFCFLGLSKGVCSDCPSSYYQPETSKPNCTRCQSCIAGGRKACGKASSGYCTDCIPVQVRRQAKGNVYGLPLQPPATSRQVLSQQCVLYPMRELHSRIKNAMWELLQGQLHRLYPWPVCRCADLLVHSVSWRPVLGSHERSGL
jgi:hypothetical protein